MQLKPLMCLALFGLAACAADASQQVNASADEQVPASAAPNQVATVARESGAAPTKPAGTRLDGEAARAALIGHTILGRSFGTFFNRDGTTHGRRSDINVEYRGYYTIDEQGRYCQDYPDDNFDWCGHIEVLEPGHIKFVTESGRQWEYRIVRGKQLH